MSYLSVPCPRCGGLVQNLRCKCGASWTSETEALYDGLCDTADRACVIVGSQQWETLDDAQPYFDMMALHKRYEQALEKHERS